MLLVAFFIRPFGLFYYGVIVLSPDDPICDELRRKRPRIMLKNQSIIRILFSAMCAFHYERFLCPSIICLITHFGSRFGRLLHSSFLKVFSRRTDSVESVREIGPAGIAEVVCAAGEGVGDHRHPIGVSQVCAGLNDDRRVGGGPKNCEAKPVVMHSEAGWIV